MWDDEPDVFDYEYAMNEDPEGAAQASGQNPVSILVISEEAETGKAWLLRGRGLDEPAWFPKSQCTYSGGFLVLPEWLREAKGIAE